MLFFVLPFRFFRVHHLTFAVANNHHQKKAACSKPTLNESNPNQFDYANSTH